MATKLLKVGYNMAKSVRDFKVRGLEDVKNFLEKEVPEIADKILAQVVLGVVSTIAKDAKTNAKASGLLSSSALVKGYKAAKRRGKRENPAAVMKGEPHWHLVEFGTVSRHHKNGKSTGSMPETPIVRPAIDAAYANMDEILDTQVRKKIAAAAKKAKKKAKS